jgi:hypothetical protein
MTLIRKMAFNMVSLVYFDKIYTLNDFTMPYVLTSQLCNQEFFGLPLFQYWSNKIIAYWNDYIIKKGEE